MGFIVTCRLGSLLVPFRAGGVNVNVNKVRGLLFSSFSSPIPIKHEPVVSSNSNCRSVGKKPFCLGVGGPSGSGKTLLASILQSNLEKRIDTSMEAKKRKSKVVRICLDSFYHPLTPSQFQLHTQGKVNFDIPDALDDTLMVRTVEGLVMGSKGVKISGYDYSTCLRSEAGSVIHSPPFDLIIVEGILSLHFQSLRNLFDFRVYIDTDLDLCLARRIIRDRNERGREIEHILTQWINTVKPSTQQFCIPTKKYADLVLKGDVHDEESLSLLTEHIFQRQFIQEEAQGQDHLSTPLSLLKK